MSFGWYLFFCLLGCTGVVLGVVRRQKLIWIASAVVAAGFGFLCICTLLLIGGID